MENRQRVKTGKKPVPFKEKAKSILGRGQAENRQRLNDLKTKLENINSNINSNTVDIQNVMKDIIQINKELDRLDKDIKDLQKLNGQSSGTLDGGSEPSP